MKETADEVRELKEEFRKLRYMLYIWFRLEKERMVNEERYKEMQKVYKKMEDEIKADFGLTEDVL